MSWLIFSFLILSVTKSHNRDHKSFNATIFILFISLTQSLFFPFPVNPPPIPSFSALLSTCINISGAYLRFNRCVRTLKLTSSLRGFWWVRVCVCAHSCIQQEWTLNVFVLSTVWGRVELQMMLAQIEVLCHDEEKASTGSNLHWNYKNILPVKIMYETELTTFL